MVNNTTGTTYPSVNSSVFINFKIKLPKNKSLIDNLEPLFNEVEVLQKEIKELDETYNNYLQELAKSAIKDKDNEVKEELKEEVKEEVKEEIKKEVKKEDTNSNKSLTVNDLREQCKSLGIKGYSKKKKEELIEMIKNHK